MEQHQIPLYVGGLLFGALAGLLIPAVSEPAELFVTPVLALLLYATFLGIPFTRLGAIFRDWRFLSTLLTVNFVVVPALVWGLSRFVAHDQVLLVGVLFVLLTPCIDYVIAFAGVAGGDGKRLLAAAPLLMIMQMVLLPVYLSLMVGIEFVQTVEFGPFIEAFLMIILLPLVAAALTQVFAARSQVVRRWERLVLAAMVPLMMATLAVVVAAHIFGVSAQLGSLLLVVPLYVLFAALMVPIGMVAGRVAGLDVPSQRAVVFSGVTRNSLVILPLVLALPAVFKLAPLVVVTQTLVELIIMVVFVRLIPRLLPQHYSFGSTAR